MQEIVFVDQAVIHIEAGRGGNGCVAFRREKFVPRGGPSGGNGGDGGSVILKATSRYNTLFHFQKYPHQRAGKGAPGEGSLRSGARGGNLTLEVPLGTLAYDAESGECLGDLTGEGQTLVVAKGGRGGRGNASFKSSVNRSPRFARPGEEGEARTLRLELKLISDVGFVGLPNAGKSTLLSALSAARPKIAPYPFTTLKPYLGVVDCGDGRTLVAAEIPGLIEGAHLGQGLGLQFLRHAERCRCLVHLVDPFTEDLDRAMETLEQELKEYAPALAKKVRLVVATKGDAGPAEGAVATVKAGARRKRLRFLAVSAVSGEGIRKLKEVLWALTR
jgi:GTP-binding protein